jgi:hypothetical protein
MKFRDKNVSCVTKLKNSSLAEGRGLRDLSITVQSGPNHKAKTPDFSALQADAAADSNVVQRFIDDTHL